MSGTYYPPPLAFPAGWPVRNSVGPIVIPYQGPPLAIADITFKLGDLILTKADNQITVEPYTGDPIPVPGQEDPIAYPTPDLWLPEELITINMFEPLVAGEAVPYGVWVDYNTVVPNELKTRDLFAGKWHICSVER